MNEIYFYKLVDKYLRGSLDAIEEKEFLRLLEQEEYRQMLEKHLQENWQREYKVDEKIQELITQNVFQQIYEQQQAPIVSINHWKKIAAAAILLVLCGTGYFLLKNNLTTEIAVATVTDVEAPGTNRATLQLADGTIIQLDSNAREVAKQGNAQVIQLANGEIRYQADNAASQTLYNTLSVPRGSKVISLTLHDGTKVWLNAESSLYYPVVFTGNTREVTITGEAYFEVSKDAKRKFIVRSGNASTEVLGTHFNINAYEEAIKVTLLEGSVKVSNGSDGKLIKPRQQADVGAAIKINDNIDTDAITAWKEGMFNFNDVNIVAVMQQISRWYNVEIEYKGSMRPLNFGGQISRKENVSAVLEVLEMTGAIKFNIENSSKGYAGKIVVIM